MTRHTRTQLHEHRTNWRPSCPYRERLSMVPYECGERRRANALQDAKLHLLRHQMQFITRVFDETSKKSSIVKVHMYDQEGETPHAEACTPSTFERLNQRFSMCLMFLCVRVAVRNRRRLCASKIPQHTIPLNDSSKLLFSIWASLI